MEKNEKMKHAGKKLIFFKKDLKQYLKQNFKNKKDYFCLIYGSYCCNLEKPFSDIDLMLIKKRVTKKQRGKFAQFVINLHKKYELPLDDEVPHIVKTMASFEDLKSCFNGEGFSKNRNSLKIPKIKKTKAFLSSKKVALRLLLNVLTSNNIIVLGNKKLYIKNKQKAFETLIKIIFLNFSLKKVSTKQFLQYLLTNGKIKDEDYLGYKNKKQIKEYLTKEIKKTFTKLSKKNIFVKQQQYYLLKEERWIYNILKQSTIIHPKTTLSN